MNPDLSALVSARLCHDLVSPLGAVGNGIELMEMNAGSRSKAEFALISDSLDTALGKLRFLRIAFGPADPGARQSLEEAGAISAAAFQGRFAVAWDREVADIPRQMAKVIYLALLCLEKSLPQGGTVVVRASEDTAELTVEGRRTAASPELWAHVLEGQPPPRIGPDAVQFVLLRACLEVEGGRIEARFSEAGASLRLAVPQEAPSAVAASETLSP